MGPVSNMCMCMCMQVREYVEAAGEERTVVHATVRHVGAADSGELRALAARHAGRVVLHTLDAMLKAKAHWPSNRGLRG
tara:strand:- start:292 stop:528 length:237 start_codon:yes stop_codon:yes gene_type:complete